MNDLTTHRGAGAVAHQTPVMQSPLGMFDPAVLDAALRAADHLANSTLVPKDYQRNPGNCLIAIQWGAELGLAPLQAMQNIAVINGRPTVWGDALLAIVQASGALESIVETRDTEGPKEGWSATCTVKRRGQSEVSHTFTWDDAKSAQLAGKQGPWQQYPKRMLQMRARGFSLRDAFADVLKGVYVAEDVQDLPPEHQGPDNARDVTPPETAGDRVKARVDAKKKPAGADPAKMIEALKVADDKAALDAAVKDVGKLDEDDKAKVRTAYAERQQVLLARESSELVSRIMTAIYEAPEGGIDSVVSDMVSDIERLSKIDPDAGEKIAADIEKARADDRPLTDEE